MKNRLRGSNSPRLVKNEFLQQNHLGPVIGSEAFEVGDEVCSAFDGADEAAATAFKSPNPGKWRANIYHLARQRLAGQGVSRIFGGEYCTASEPGH